MDFLLDRLPLTEDDGRRQLENAMLHVTREVTGFGVLGVVTLVFASTNVMGSIRQALNAAYAVEDPRPPAQAKLWDLLMVLVFGVLDHAVVRADAHRPRGRSHRTRRCSRRAAGARARACR